MSKDVSFPGKPPSKLNSRAAEAFAELRLASEERTKRVTFDIPATLHQRVKQACVREDISMSQVLREFLERRFPQAPQ
ncbi:MAG: hypothetical protein KDB14_28260 [Planctomycetales bacterium]|nr:hypothetical protein [Planctomycetales bacterium]